MSTLPLFWGETLSGKTPKGFEPDSEDESSAFLTLQVTHLALSPKAKDKCVVQARSTDAQGEEQDFILATLTPGKTDQVSLNVSFSDKVDFSLVEGHGPVSILGHIFNHSAFDEGEEFDSEGEEFDSEDDEMDADGASEEDDDDSQEDDLPPAKAGKALPAPKAAAAPAKAAAGKPAAAAAPAKRPAEDSAAGAAKKTKPAAPQKAAESDKAAPAQSAFAAQKGKGNAAATPAKEAPKSAPTPAKADAAKTPAKTEGAKSAAPTPGKDGKQAAQTPKEPKQGRTPAPKTPEVQLSPSEIAQKLIKLGGPKKQDKFKAHVKNMYKYITDDAVVDSIWAEYSSNIKQ